MNHYKDENGNVYGFESDEEMQRYKPGLVRMTEAEFEAFRNPPHPPPEPRTILSSREFLERFTNAEYAAVRSVNNIDLHRAYDSLIAAQFVDLNDPAVGMGLDLMMALGIIDEARKSELLEPATE